VEGAPHPARRLNDPAPPGHLGLRVDLGYYDQDVDPTLWKVFGTGDASYVLLRHVSNRLLRANGRYRLWLSGVSVDDVDNQSTMMHWKVETIPTSPNPPALPARTPVSSARPVSRDTYGLAQSCPSRDPYCLA
jgi:hypothetical protein